VSRDRLALRARVAIGALLLAAASPILGIVSASATANFPTRLPLPQGAASDHADLLVGTISCVSSTSCRAVGTYRPTGKTRLLPALFTFDGRAWRASALPLPAGANATNPGAIAESVSCVTTHCLVVGSYSDAKLHTEAFSIHSDTGSFTLSRSVPSPADAASDPVAQLLDVSCASATHCVAVGSYHDRSGAYRPMAVSWSNGSWSAARALPLPVNHSLSAKVLAQQGSAADSISCGSTSDCLVGGTYEAGAGVSEGFVVHLHDGLGVSSEEVALPAIAASDPLVSIGAISCVGPSCALSGTFARGDGTTRAFVVSGLVGAFTARASVVTPPDNAPADTSASLSSLGCASAGSCTAAGTYRTGDGPTALFEVAEHSGHWSKGVALDLPTDSATEPSALVSGISCTAVGSCTGIGRYLDDSGHHQVVALRI
jgi:hypothetical protein